MKKKFAIVCSLVTVALVYQACDYVRNAVPASSNSTTTTGSGSTTVYRKVLIEDYTGHKCGNCPAAARELHKLDSIYPGKIVPVAVHAGFYANVTPSSNPPYPTDLKSQAGTDYDNFFGNSVAGNPNGLVNRTGYGTPNQILQWGDWSSVAAPFFTTPADFSISITNTYTSGTNQVTSKITSKALNGVTGIYNLVVLMTEDSIIAEQIDYSLPAGNQYITNYQFDHVLRGAVNSSWGTQIFTGTVAAGDSVVSTYANFQLSSTWQAKHCKIVAFIYDADAASARHYEVMQAESKDVW